MNNEFIQHYIDRIVDSFLSYDKAIGTGLDSNHVYDKQQSKLILISEPTGTDYTDNR